MKILGLPIGESERISLLREEKRIAEANAQSFEESFYELKERITELQLSQEDYGWQQLSGENNKEFAREQIAKINRLARLYWMKNPLIRRAVETQKNYVFGKGINIYAENDQINEVIQGFLKDPKNRSEFTEHQTMMQKETDLALFGNLFFVLFVDQNTGKVKVRTIPTDEIDKIVTEPEDSKTPLYYKRVYNVQHFDVRTGQHQPEQKTIYYPHWKNEDTEKIIPDNVIAQNAYVYHVSVNRLSDQKLGLSEVYSAIDWSKAYKEFMEDWASLARAYSRLAWKYKAKGKKARSDAKSKLNTTVKTQGYETNPPPVTGSTAILGEHEDLSPIKTSGMSMSASDGDKMVNMVCAGTGIFYHYLVGDPSTGNLATAKAMELPMLIQFQNRQRLWSNVIHEILWFVIEQSVKAINGKLRDLGAVEKDEEGSEIVKFDTDKEGNEIDSSIKAKFPDLLEKDTWKVINSIIKGATLGGPQMTAQTMTMKDVSRYILQALGEENVEQKLEELYPEKETEANRKGYKEVVEELTSNIKMLIENKNGG